MRRTRVAHKAVSLATVAREAGCSVTTVSHVLNAVPAARVSDETRRRVSEALRRLDYQPHRVGRALSSRRTRLLGLVTDYGRVEFPAEVAHLQILSSVQDVLRDTDYDLVLVHRQKAPGWVRSRGLDGAILLSPVDRAEVALFVAHDMPLVAMEAPWPTPVSSVGIDEGEAVRLALAHLYALGHRQIAFLGPARHRSCMGLRTAAYRRFMAAHGLPVAGGLLFREDSLDLDTILEDVPRRVRDDGVTALLGMTDGLAVRAMNALRQAGIVAPRDVSVMGIDGAIAARLSVPPLTTIANPVAERARHAAERLLRLIDEPGLPIEHAVFPVSLVRGGSDGPPPAASGVGRDGGAK